MSYCVSRLRRPGLLALVALMLALLLVPHSTLAQTNLITNGSFSSGTAGWNIVGDAGTENCCAGAYPTGSYPEAFAHPNGTGGTIALWQSIPNPQAGTYTLSGWINSSGGAQQVLMQADNGDPNVRYCQTPVTNTAGWQQFSCSFTLASPAPVHVALIASNAPATAWGWVAWDSISLVRSGGSTPTPVPTSFDLAKYLGRTDGASGPVYQLTTGEIMQIQPASSVWHGQPGFYQVKNSHWEEMAYDSSYIYRLRDTSGKDDFYALFANCPSACDLGSRWAPRTMRVNDAYWRSNNWVKTYRRSSSGVCTKASDGYAQATSIRLERWFSSLNINGYTVNDVIMLKVYYDAGFTQPWEEYYYAKGVGLVQWRDVTNGTQNSYAGSASPAPSREPLCTTAP